MSTGLRAAVAGHLAERRARGYRLEGRERLLGSFLDSLEARGETRITVPAALAFATAPAGTARAWHAQRLAAVRSFAGYVHAMDPAAADPIPGGLIPGRIARRAPYLYSGEETARLMAAAAALPSPVLAASMRTLIGLLASTGVRSGEALALDACDLDTEAQVLTVTGKYGRKRLIALHPSAAAALSDYLRFREQHAADGTAALLIGQAGRRLGRSVANPAFRSLATGCGLEPQPGCRSPRLHDFRHAFAVSTLIDAHRQGRDVDACIAVLSTHLGHVTPSHTYWYLTVTPALADAVSERAALYYQGGTLPMTALAPAIESFFTDYLIAQRGASPHTIASYRDTFRLLFAWIREQSGTRPSDLDFADIDAATVTGFLAMLEDERHNTAGPAASGSPPSTPCSATPPSAIPSMPRSSPASWPSARASRPARRSPG